MPLERPKGVTKEIYTPDEAEAAIKAAAAREAEQTEPGTTADVHYDFSQFGLDRSQSTFAKNLRTSLIVDPPDGKIPPVNAAGTEARGRSARRRGRRRAVSTTRCENMPIGSRCIIMGGAGPPMMNAGYNANYQIVQAPGYVMILTEMIHDVRIIPLDNRPQPPSQACGSGSASRAAAGKATRWSSRRRTSTARTPFRGASENLKVTERFTRMADDMIDYKFTVEDPATWDGPWTAKRRWRRPKGRSSSSRVTKPTTASPTSWPARAPTRRRRPSRQEGIELDMRAKLAVVVAVRWPAAGVSDRCGRIMRSPPSST